MNKASTSQTTVAAIVQSRSFSISSLCYFTVLIAMFWPLLKGDVLSSGAGLFLSQPFRTPLKVMAIPYVSTWTTDFIEQFSEFEEYQYRCARHGRFPTWNPHIFMGQPFHGDEQSAMLFPTHWIYFLIDPNLARGPMTILRLWISGAALFCLLRKSSLSPVPAFVGGAVWMLSSFNIHWMLWPHSNASLWMPVVLLSTEPLLLGPSWRRYAIASLAIAPLFLSGHPGTEYLCGYLIAIYLAFRWTEAIFIGTAFRRSLLSAIAISSAALTGLLASAVSVLPLFYQIQKSFEYFDAAAHRSMISSLPANSLWLLLMPEYFGRPRGAFPLSEYTGPDNYIEMTLWFGGIGLILALTAVFSTQFSRASGDIRRWRSPISFLIWFGTFTFVISLMIGFKI
jgi:hypothetical protein